ncbi:DUF4097 family beta strand repeat-containing protein [Chryseolinea lacunae]|uniref:Adhesin domain-containing protein n=1 Tax=Chryseolinea lacunae TaxID=2801331 RepID=A0ABS1KPA1_9BACT|nr:hypothetical protein [Chryseolinea lacunae]MBL0741256.1 hypothetical protein [Chryseolinea lacunae]
MKTWITLGLMAMAMLPLAAQTHTEKVVKELSFEKKNAANAVMIANINGSIKVVGYEGEKILVEVTKTINAKSAARLEKGKSEIQLGVVDLADSLILYVAGECGSFGKQDHKHNNHNNRNWGYSWNNNCDNCRHDYDYKMDFVVKVPYSINLSVSTVNNGDVDVENVKGAVMANNVNGSIRLQNLIGEAEASTINGNVDVEYAKNPPQDCRFYTLNGDINAWFQKGLAANLSFESFNGSFYTNIEKLEPMPVTVEKKDSNKGIKYKVNDNRFKVGTGGANLDFETFNGDVYLKEKTN